MTPSKRYTQTAEEAALVVSVQRGEHYQHRLFQRQSLRQEGSLHVYIEGDGMPWIGRVPSADPTPRTPMALPLMLVDPNPSILVGRPCYHGLHNDADCSADHWTDQRYSAATVSSMSVLIDRLREQGGFSSVNLIGYSGGGTLAQLIAAQTHHVQAVITIGANLDTAGWTRQRGFSPLEGSMNPADRPALPDYVMQIHYIGRNDGIVPIMTRARFFDNHPEAIEIIIDKFGHQCCWLEDWPRLLNRALALDFADVRKQGE
ncbi:MAG: alpha/beta fold hydrolase [Pseudomonadota bacterium]